MWALLALVVPDAARAHAVLLEAEPADGARLARAPGEVRLRFNEAVVPLAFRLLDAAGTTPPMALEGARADAGAATGGGVTVPLPAGLPDGGWLLSWRVASGDSHPVGGTLAFAVGAGVTAPTAPSEAGASAAASGPPGWPAVAARFAHRSAALLGIGLALLAALGTPALAEAARRRAVPALLLGAVAAPPFAGLAGAELAGLPPRAALLGAAPWEAAARTSIGAALATGAAGLGLLALACARPAAGWRLPRRAAFALGLAAAAGSFAMSGHAAAAGPLAGAAAVAHALGAALWVGGFVALRPVARRPAAAVAAPAARRFSRLALVAVPALILAGAALAWAQLGGASGARASLGDAYTRLLLLKAALVAGLLGLGWVNWRIIGPRLAAGEAGAGRALRRTLAADAALALAVLAVTAALATRAPPRAHAVARPVANGAGDGAAARAAGAVPAEVAGAEGESRTAYAALAGHAALITVLPGRAGAANQVEVDARGDDGRPIAAREARVRLGPAEAGIEPRRLGATPTGPGRWRLEGVALPLPGRWAIRVDLLVDDFTRLTFEAPVDIAPAVAATGPTAR